jgi:hypothetical protein
MKNTRWTTGTLASGIALLGIAIAGAPPAAAGSRDWVADVRSSVSVEIRIGDVTVFWRSGHGYQDGYYDREGRRYHRDTDGCWYRDDGDTRYRYDDHGHRWSRDDHDERQSDNSRRDSDRYDSGRSERGRRGGDHKSRESDSGNHGRDGNRENDRGHDDHRR